MLHEAFSSIFTGQTERLDMFFHRKIRSAKVCDNIEQLKEDLIQDTALAVFEKLKDPKYKYYDLTALIWLKAQDIWSEYIHNYEKLPISDISLEELSEVFISIDSYAMLESADYLNHLQLIGDKTSWDMMALHVDGYKYSLLAEQYETSVAAVKMKLARLRNKLGRMKP